MSNAIFPTLAGLAYPVDKTPIWSNRIQTGTSGKETRLALWSYPIWQYEVSYNFLRSDASAEFQTLLAFYSARQGSYDDWLFNDPDDKTATLAAFGTGDGTTTVFQLASVANGISEPVKAVNTITQVRKAGVATTAYTLDANAGTITFTTAPTAGQALDWTGTYYKRCRFSGDEFNLSKFAALIWETKSLKFQSVK